MSEMSVEIEVENIKCGGCANSIRKGLLEDSRITAVEVDIDNGQISYEGDETTRSDAIKKPLKMGYPKKGSVEGIKAATAKAKSFASCAIGKMTDNN